MTATLQERNDWLRLRKNYIGASDAPVIMNGSHYETTPFKLWQEKLGLLQRDEDNFITQRGRLKEEPARQLYEKMTNNLMMPEIVFHKEKKFMMATLDGLSANGDIAVEIKCLGAEDHNLAQLGEVPKKYFPQLQHQLACLDIKLLHYFSYFDGKGVIVEVERDDEYIERMYSEEKRFWDHVLNLEAPELCNKDFASLVGCLEWKEAAELWVRAQEQLKDATEQEKIYRSQLIALANNQSSIGHGVRLTKVVRKGLVDYKAVPELKGVDLEPYRKKPTESWRLSAC